MIIHRHLPNDHHFTLTNSGEKGSSVHSRNHCRSSHQGQHDKEVDLDDHLQKRLGHGLDVLELVGSLYHPVPLFIICCHLLDLMKF